ncbi:hypothetical protein DOS81_08325, partial [Staphylococcus felis]|uniref:hypothetical protein n=1 Tax=Staphylococcus felis TaxID=46127 RepID=UPI000E36963D
LGAQEHRGHEDVKQAQAYHGAAVRVDEWTEEGGKAQSRDGCERIERRDMAAQFYFFSSRTQHTRFALLSWARTCV